MTNGDLPGAVKPAAPTEPTTDMARALRRVALARLLAWLGIALIGYALYRGQSGLAWQAPAFALLYNLPVLLLSGRESRSRPAFALDIATDLVAATGLVTATGGFASPFLPLPFLAVVEGAVLLGGSGGGWVAGCAAALNLVHLRLGAQPSSLLVFALHAGMLTLLAVALRRVAPPAPRTVLEPSDTVLQQRTIEDVEEQVEELERQNRLLRANYQEVTAVARRQQAKMAQHNVAREILQAGLEDSSEEALYTRVLRALMGSLEARGAALWLLDPGGERMRTVQVVGQVAPLLKERAVPVAPESQPSDIRRACEERLRESAPLPSANPFSLSTGGSDAPSMTDAEKPPPGAPAVLSVSLRNEQGFLGVIGLCAPAGGRFEEEDSETLAELSGCAAMAVCSIRDRANLRRSARENALMLEVSRRAQTAESVDQIAVFLVEAAAELTACENATLFLLDPDNQRLHARATRGLPVNLMDHIPFERGTGVSAWVAQERKQLYIPDLTRETRLLNVELIPPRIRSFLSVPMTARDRVIGVLNISHSLPDAFTPEHMRLLTTLAGQAALAIEQSEAVRAAEQTVLTDPLTGLLNYRYFLNRLTQEIRRARRYHLALTLLLLEVEGKEAIRARSAAAADRLAADLANLLRANLRETELLARDADDRFAILFTQTAAEEAAAAVIRLRRLLAEHRFTLEDGSALPATVRVGMACYPAHGTDRRTLLKQAEEALAASPSSNSNR